ncbi:MAG: nucleoside monophosphate kinase [Patescibacteria group bacterium]
MNPEPRTVFFLGKPGSGKGTQAKLLADHTGWTVLASGDQFRAIATEDTPAGRKTKEEMEKGMLSPHWFAMYIYLKSLFSVEGTQNVIFDGFNRKLPEAELIRDSLSWLGRPFEVVNIAVSDDEVAKRLASRSAVSGRADDHYVAKRLEEYNTFTTEALKLFEDMGVLIQINGEQTPEEVAADVVKALNLA